MKITVKPKNKLNFSSLKIAILAGISNFLVTFFYASGLNVWGDEAFSIQATKLSYLRMIELTAKDVHPPLYYIFLKFWTGLFGYQEMTLRLMSMLFMFLAVVTLVLISYRYFNKKASIITGALLSLSPFAIRIGLEIRMYSMAFLFCTLFLWAYLEYRNSKKNIFWLLMSIFGALSIYTHYYSVFMIITVVILDYINIRAGSEKLELVKFIKNSVLVKVGLIMGVLYLPWLTTFLGKIKGLNGGFWVPKPMVTSPLYTPFNFLSGIDEYFLWNKPAMILSLLILVVILFKLKSVQKQISKLDANTKFFGLVFAIPALIMLVVSLTMPTSVYYGRYLSLNAFIGFLILISSIVAKEAKKKILLVGIICLFIGNIYMLFYGNTRVLGGNWTTVYNDKSVLECTLSVDTNQESDIYLTDDKMTYLTINYYLKDVIKPVDTNFEVYYITDKPDELKGYDAWIDSMRYRGEFNYLLKNDVPANFNFRQNNVWYVSPANSKFANTESKLGIYKNFKSEKVCQSDRKLLTGYDSDKAYRLSPIER